MWVKIEQLFESDVTRIKLRMGKKSSGEATAAAAFIEDFNSMTHEHPFTHGMRYFADGPVLVKMSASPDFDDEVDLNDIQSKAKGAGARAMEEICRLADKHQVTIDLYAEGYAHVPTPKLVEYYKRFGFQERNEYMGQGQDMIRNPR
jgi:hypothetical protein